MSKIVLFGDSYTAGRIPHTSIDGTLARFLNVPTEYALAVSGSTAQDWATVGYGNLLKARECDAKVAVGSLGGNDLFQALSDGVVSPFERVRILMSLADVLFQLSLTKDIIILMIYPDPFMGKRADAVEAHKQLSGALKYIASMCRNVTMLDLSTVLSVEDFDGIDIHPNEGGYKKMSDAIQFCIQQKEREAVL